MSFLFKVKIQGVSQRIELSENELNETNTAVSEAFYSKGNIFIQFLKYKLLNMILFEMSFFHSLF